MLTFHYLESSYPLWDRCKFLVPVTEVSRRWHELSRPLMFKALRLTPSRAPKLLAVLNTTRNWSKCVKSLRISFSPHYNQNCTPTLLSLIASCSCLERLDLVGCGKPVYKSFLAQSGSVLFADDLFAVLGRIQHLVLTGGRKRGSTGLDVAKLTSFLLPCCRSLQILERGEVSFQSVQCAPLQPMITPDGTTGGVAGHLNAPPQAGSQPMPALAHLRSLTLASGILTSRAFAQAMATLHPGVVEELVVRANDAPNRRYFEDMLATFGPTLRSLKMDVMFPTHRLYQVLDTLPVLCPNLQVLDLRGPLCTDLMLNHLSSNCPHLSKLVLMHNRAVSHVGLIHFLTSRTTTNTTGEPHPAPTKLLVLDDLLAPSWTPWVASVFARSVTELQPTWRVEMAESGWRDLYGDEPMHGGQRRLLSAGRLRGWPPIELSQEDKDAALKAEAADAAEYAPESPAAAGIGCLSQSEVEEGADARVSLPGANLGSGPAAQRPEAFTLALGTTDSASDEERALPLRSSFEPDVSTEDNGNSSSASSEPESDSDSEAYESDWGIERRFGIEEVKKQLTDRDKHRLRIDALRAYAGPPGARPTPPAGEALLPLPPDPPIRLGVAHSDAAQQQQQQQQQLGVLHLPRPQVAAANTEGVRRQSTSRRI